MTPEALSYSARQSKSPLTEMRKVGQGSASEIGASLPTSGFTNMEIIGDFDKEKCLF